METIIIQVIAFQFIFLLIYELLLKRDTFFNWNRAYLLGTSVCSLVLPFVKINAFSNVIPADYVVSLPTVFIGKQSVKQIMPVEQIDTVLLHNTSVNYYVWFWGVGAILCAFLLVYKLFRIGVFQYANTSIKEKGYTVTTLKNSEDAFSFLNTIFLGDQLKEEQKESILKHEKVHVKDKHTLDLLWFEVLRIFFWFNPLIYIYQKRITEVHEFIADKSASKHQKNYYENLLAKTFNIAQFSVVNQFYSSSLIKKRIIMLTKKQSNKIKLSKFLTIIPVVLGMLIYVSCSDTIDNENTYLSEVNNKTTVIEDVITIVNNTMTYEEFEKGITEDQFNTIIGNLKKYKKVNSNKIENTNFDEYSAIWDKLHGSTIQNFNGTSENKDLYNFKIASVFAEMLLKDIEDATYEIQGLMSVKMLLSPKMVNRLEELNYVLPNKEKYLNMASEVVEETTSSEISFKTLDQSPLFPGCDENATSEELKKCFSKSISTHVAKNFNTKLADNLNLTGRQKILVAFKIDKLGNITDVKVRAPHSELADEAKRVINALPKLQPGMHNGKAVTVPYSLPIVFKIEA